MGLMQSVKNYEKKTKMNQRRRTDFKKKNN